MSFFQLEAGVNHPSGLPPLFRFDFTVLSHNFSNPIPSWPRKASQHRPTTSFNLITPYNPLSSTGSPHILVGFQPSQISQFAGKIRIAPLPAHGYSVAMEVSHVYSTCN
jgi:hypothetical protein